MDYSYFSLIIKILMVVFIYFIVFFALKIMYKDVKRGKKANGLDWKLRVESSLLDHSTKPGDEIPLGNALTIGRSEACQLVLATEYVSSRHAKIYFEEGRYVIEDLNSTNGTYLNETKIVNKKILQLGDIIKLADVTFKVIE